MLKYFFADRFTFIAVHLPELQSKHDQLFFYFYGNPLQETGQSWCPDCVRADPHIRSTLESVGNDPILVELPVGFRDDWKNNPGHAYREHPDLQIRSVPTLLKWTKEDGFSSYRLEDADCENDDILTQFFKGSNSKI